MRIEFRYNVKAVHPFEAVSVYKGKYFVAMSSCSFDLAEERLIKKVKAWNKRKVEIPDPKEVCI